MKKLFLATIAATMAVFCWCQDIVPSPTIPTQDASIGQGEYGYSGNVAKMTLFASLSPDSKTLYLALEAPTAGWVAIGLGSASMNGAYFVMGTDSGAPSVVEHIGKGFSHSDSGAAKVLKSTVRTAGGKTVLEFSIPSAGYAKGGKLPLVLAYGKGANLGAKHIARASLSPTIGK